MGFGRSLVVGWATPSSGLWPPPEDKREGLEGK
jgi:hypothetical protein